ncbi:MAG: hypothetical protein KME18_16885 [Phormidium tanganyikae FI6-MK23]|jgi:hypothetical protein|nr:hypothetical protein [Phormidium tanganyikae FI6-MK23]
MPKNGYPGTIVSPEILEKLGIVPQLAAQHGRGFTLLDGKAIKYFPISDLQRIPNRFSETICKYSPESEVLLINGRNLDRCSWMLIALKPQSKWVWENSVTRAIAV